MEWRFEADGPLEADVVVPAGSVEVEQADGSEVSVLLEPVRDTDRAHEFIADRADVSFAGRKLRVHMPERSFRNVEVRCRLRLPEGSALASKTASADLRSSVGLRAFDGTTASGDTELADVTGDARHRSASGDLTCEAVGGRLDVRTASGDISVRRAVGEVQLAVASGDVHLEDAESSVDVRSASGDVRLDCVRRGRIRAQTASGDVTIAVASGVGAYLDVTTVSGDTRCTLPFHDGAPGGGGDLEIVARTVSGDVLVRGASR